MSELRRARDHMLYLEDELAKEWFEGMISLVLYLVPGGMHLIMAGRTRTLRPLPYFAGYAYLTCFFWNITWFGLLFAAGWVTFFLDWKRWRRTNP